jgi:hypothetical protein
MACKEDSECGTITDNVVKCFEFAAYFKDMMEKDVGTVGASLRAVAFITKLQDEKLKYQKTLKTLQIEFEDQLSVLQTLLQNLKYCEAHEAADLKDNTNHITQAVKMEINGMLAAQMHITAIQDKL